MNLEVRTVSAKETWRSPDGQRVLYELTMDYKGQPVKAKTFSKAIASEGWSGTVESYEKEGKFGPETFVKQPAKEGYTRQPKDEAAIRAMWAVSQAIAWLNERDAKASLNSVELIARELYGMVDIVKTPAEPTPQITDEELNSPIDLSKVKDVFSA